MNAFRGQSHFSRIMFCFVLLSFFFIFMNNAQAKDKVKELTFAVTMEDTGIDKELTQRFKAKVEELSNGSLQINLFMGGVLGDTRVLMEQMRMGEVDLGYYAEFGQLYYPKYDATTIPFLWPDKAAVTEYFSGPVGEKAKKQVAEKGGAILLGPMHSYGSRWTTSNKPIRNADDLQGLKIRMPNISWWIDVWKGMGASPTPVSSAEIYSALKTGVVDAQENFLTNIFGRKLWEVQKYAIATKHIDFYMMWAASSKTWDTLTEEEKGIIIKSANDAVDYVTPKITEMNEGFVNSLKENNMEIIVPDRESLIKAARPSIVKLIKESLAPEVQDEVSKYLK